MLPHSERSAVRDAAARDSVKDAVVGVEGMFREAWPGCLGRSVHSAKSSGCAGGSGRFESADDGIRHASEPYVVKHPSPFRLSHTHIHLTQL